MLRNLDAVFTSTLIKISFWYHDFQFRVHKSPVMIFPGLISISMQIFINRKKGEFKYSQPFHTSPPQPSNLVVNSSMHKTQGLFIEGYKRTTGFERKLAHSK